MKKLLVLFFFISNYCTAQIHLTQGLAAYYPFNGNANDESGNNNNAVFNNAILTTDKAGKANSAYHFNGKNTYIKIPNNPSLNFANKITLALQVKPTGFYYDVCHASAILTKGGGNYNTGNYALRFDDALFTHGTGCEGEKLLDSAHFNFRGTGTTFEPYTPYIQKNKWYSVVYTNDGEYAKLYVDCELKYSVKFSETFTNNEAIFLGKSDDDFFPFWLNADLDEVRIYNRPLNIDEIDSLCKIVKNPISKPKEVLAPILEKRNNKLLQQIEVEHDSISIALYDNGIVDGDSVTLIYNNQILTTHQKLTETAINFIVKVDRTSTNELVMYAENLGSIPPNTALMVIYDGKKRYELNISSTKTSNGVISFKLKE